LRTADLQRLYQSTASSVARWSLIAPQSLRIVRATKALSLSNLRFVMRAYIQRDYSKVVFFELVVQSLDGCRHFSVSIGGSVSPPW
jgi:hypothetical protein